MKAEITDFEEVVAHVSGLQIVNGGQDSPEGIHFLLSDGRYLVVTALTGSFYVGVYRADKKEIN